MGRKTYSEHHQDPGSVDNDVALNPYAPECGTMPDHIAIFPLNGALLLPMGNLPLNIFEPRYVAMIADAMASPHRMIGMVQPRPVQDGDTSAPTYKIGCAGKITDFHETPDGRFEITLTGISRFKITEELELDRGGYRKVKAKWCAYKDDFEDRDCLGLNRDDLKDALREYFQTIQMDCDWQAIDSAPDGKLITCLSMICPLEPTEKQALLEAGCCKSRAEMFIEMLKMATQSAALKETSPSTQH